MAKGSLQVWPMAALMALALVLVLGLLSWGQESEAKQAFKNKPRPASTSVRTTRRPSSQRMSREQQARVQAQARAAANRSSMSRLPSRGRAHSITRPRSRSSSTTGSTRAAAARRRSIQSLTRSYRPRDPSPLRADATPNAPRFGDQAARLQQQVNRQSVQIDRLNSRVNSIYGTLGRLEARVNVSAYQSQQALTQSYISMSRP